VYVTQYRGSAFKIPTPTRWLVVVSGKEKVDELRKANEDVVSFRKAVNEVSAQCSRPPAQSVLNALQLLQLQYILGPEIAFDPYHVAVVRTPLTRNIGIKFPDIQDEIAVGFAEHMPMTEG
jgi:hypothetical protein